VSLGLFSCLYLLLLFKSGLLAEAPYPLSFKSFCLRGINALDAVMLAYSSISSLRQQLPPGDRVHGIVTNGGSQPNIIPELAGVEYFIRSPTLAGLEMLRGRVDNCFKSVPSPLSSSLPRLPSSLCWADRKGDVPLRYVVQQRSLPAVQSKSELLLLISIRGTTFLLHTSIGG
jgi:hypothetical protein